jgi:hypothetical protein
VNHEAPTVRALHNGLWVLAYHGKDQFTFPTREAALAALETITE